MVRCVVTVTVEEGFVEVHGWSIARVPDQPGIDQVRWSRVIVSNLDLEVISIKPRIRDRKILTGRQRCDGWG